MMGGCFSASRMSVRNVSVLAASSTSVASLRPSGGQQNLSSSHFGRLVEAERRSAGAGSNPYVARVGDTYSTDGRKICFWYLVAVVGCLGKGKPSQSLTLGTGRDREA